MLCFMVIHFNVSMILAILCFIMVRNLGELQSKHQLSDLATLIELGESSMQTIHSNSDQTTVLALYSYFQQRSGSIFHFLRILSFVCEFLDFYKYKRYKDYSGEINWSLAQEIQRSLAQNPASPFSRA